MGAMGDEFLTEIKRVVADPTAGPTLNDLLNGEAVVSSKRLPVTSSIPGLRPPMRASSRDSIAMPP